MYRKLRNVNTPVTENPTVWLRGWEQEYETKKVKRMRRKRIRKEKNNIA
jgi:hypothetical protein